MSDNVDDLLMRGIAAAKVNDRDEARFYLEWVLRYPEVAAEQQTEAWLWLSQITDDPASKRDYLESILAIDPSHPQARRELAILDGRLKPEDVIDPWQTVQPVQPASTPAPDSVRRYVCPKCGGKMAFDPDQHALTCSFCGHHMSEEQAVAAGAFIQEHDFTVTLPTAKAQRWELPTARRLTCQGCGATFALPPLQVSGECPFCGSVHVVETTEERELIQPDGVLPFQCDAGAAADHVRRWLQQQRFRPGDLDKAAAITPPRGVYLPFWTFDLGGEVTWQALVKEGDQWIPRSGSHLIDYQALFVPASASLPDRRLNAIANFDANAVLPYSADLLADWTTEIYQISMAEASLVAHQRAFEEAKRIIAHRTLGGETVNNLACDNLGIIINTYRLNLLPMWLTGYRYKGQNYPVAVNGQTGGVAGDLPRSGVQKLLAGLFGDK